MRKALGYDKKLALLKLKKIEYDLFNSDIKAPENGLQEAVESFRYYLSKTGITNRQVKDIIAKVNKFTSYCSKQKITKLNDIKREHANKYILFRHKENITPLSPITIKREASFLKRYFNYCISMSLTHINPFNNVEIACKKRTEPRYYFKDFEIDSILEFADIYRDFFSFLLHTGLRCTDAFKLQPKHIVDGYLKLQMNKTGDFLNVPLPDAIKQILEPRMADKYIFPEVRSDWDRRLCLRNLKQHFTKDFVRSNNINLHTFRHTYAHTMLNKGVPKEVLQTLLGHRSIRTTEIYANWVRKEELERWV